MRLVELNAFRQLHSIQSTFDAIRCNASAFSGPLALDELTIPVL